MLNSQPKSKSKFKPPVIKQIGVGQIIKFAENLSRTLLICFFNFSNNSFAYFSAKSEADFSLSA